jgi:hypothetical protein
MGTVFVGFDCEESLDGFSKVYVDLSRVLYFHNDTVNPNTIVLHMDNGESVRVTEDIDVVADVLNERL